MAKVRKGDDYISIAKRLGIDASKLAEVNGYSKLNTGQDIRLPRITAVGEKGFEYIVDTPGPGMQVLPHEQSKALAKKGILPSKGMAIGGFLGDDPYGGINPYEPTTSPYVTQPTSTYTAAPASTTYTDTIRVPGTAPTTVTSQGPTTQATTTPNTYYDNILGVTSQGPTPAPTPYVAPPPNQTYTDTVRDPNTGTVLGTVQSAGPTQQYTDYVPQYLQDQDAAYLYGVPEATTSFTSSGPTFTPTYTPSNLPTELMSSQDNTGTFSDTNIKLYEDYFLNPSSLSASEIQYIDNTIAGKYVPTYHNALLDFLNGQTDVYGTLNAVPIPGAILGSLDLTYLDPDWFQQFGQVLADQGYSYADIVAWWLASVGYEFSDSGMYMEYTGAEGGLTADGSGGSGGSGGGGGSYGSGGYRPSANYSNAMRGLVNWRGVSFG